MLVYERSLENSAAVNCISDVTASYCPRSDTTSYKCSLCEIHKKRKSLLRTKSHEKKIIYCQMRYTINVGCIVGTLKSIHAVS